MRQTRKCPGKAVLLSCLMVALFAGILAPEGSEAQDRPDRRVLPNGLTLILKENHAAPVVSIQVWIKSGSSREGPREYGVAHVLEHMVFKGTEQRGVGALAQEAEAAGGEINAYTNWDNTVYFVSLASRFAEKGIDILADMLSKATLDAEELAREKEVVLEEIRRSNDIPEDRFTDSFFQKAFAVHPYGRPVIGFAETVRAFTREDLVGFYRKWYVPENMVWVIAGDFEPVSLLPKLVTRLSELPALKVPVGTTNPEPPQEETRALVLRQEAVESHLKVGFHIPQMTHPDVPALDLLAQILGQGRSSRLYQAFRLKKRLVNSVYASSLTPKDPGLFIVGASLDSSDLEEALPGILQEVFRTAFEPVTEDELRTAKTQIQSDFIYGRQTVEGQARELGYLESLAEDLDFDDQYLGQLQAVRPQDLLRVARTYLQPHRATAGILLPAASQSAAADNLTKIVEKSYEDAESRHGKPVAGSEPGEGAVFRARLSNGALLLVKENPGVPLVSWQALFLGGLLSETAETNGVSEFTARMLTKGTASRSAEQIAREIESLAGSVSGFSGRSGFGLSTDVVSWNLQPALEVFTDLLLHPEFPQEYVEKTRRDILAAIKNQEDDLATLAFRLFWKNLYPCHPYGLDPLGSPKSVDAIRREDLVNYYQRMAVGPNLVLAVVGDVNREQVLKLAEQSVGRLPAKAVQLPEPDCKAAPITAQTRFVSPDKLQAHLVIGARSVRYTNRDRYRLAVLSAILAGQGGRLFLDLRDKESLAYALTAFNQDAYDPGAFLVYIATRPENLAKARDGVHRQLAKLRDDEVSAQELDRAKNYLVGTYDLGLQTNSAQASLLAASERFGAGYQEYWRYPERIREVTAGEVKKVARKYLCPECLVEAVVSPKADGEQAAPLKPAPTGAAREATQ